MFARGSRVNACSQNGVFNWFRAQWLYKYTGIGPQHPGGLRRFKSLTSFPTQNNFEKIYYKYIPLCSSVCFEPSFKATGILNFWFCPEGHYFCHIFPNIGTTLRTEKLLVTSTPLVGKIKPQPCGTFWEVTTRHIRRFKYFQKAVIMFWYLEHWWILYLKQPYKMRCYVTALMILYQQTMSRLCSYSKHEVVGNHRGDLGQPR